MTKKILLVDDDGSFRQEFKECFREYEIIEVCDGREALEILKRPHVIDLVILDVRMPGLSGTEVLSQIKEMAPDLGIIIFTGYSSEDVAIEALKGHADDYIEKPLDIEKTKDMIERLLAKTPVPRRARHGAGSTSGKAGKAREFIERNSCKKISLKDVARDLSISPKYLSRMFKEAFGAGFSQYKLKLRIGEAKKLLKNTPLNINEISQRLNYENAESFIRIFKKNTGYTPTEYRKKRKV